MQAMRRFCVLVVALACALAVASSALALPHLSAAQTRQISTLVNRWVNDVVLRKNLADGWTLAGPQLRGGTAQQAWDAGRALPVQHFPLVGTDFRKDWYVQWKTPTTMGLVVTLRAGRGKNAEEIQEQTGLVLRDGHWLFNAFYPNGVFRLGKGHSGSCASAKCKVTGLNDYAPSPTGGSALGGSARIGPHWFLYGGVALVAVFLAVPLGIALRVRSRHRRAQAEYLASR
jgi:hypothetical protein